jgi:H+/Cl- antiporter ClcA
MKRSLDSQFDSQSQLSDSASYALSGVDSAARGGVVNRTHRVVRQRAKVMQARRSHVRSLMVPLIICSALLILSIFAVWSGLYQYQATEAAEAVQADVAALGTNNDANNQFLVVLLWFVPVSLALLAAVWFRRFRTSVDHEAVR